MGSQRIRNLRNGIRSALAGAAIAAQVLLLFAPLIDVHDSDRSSGLIAAGVSTPGIATLTADRGSQSEHNATTCPACIAQSLHAQTVAAVRIPTAVVSDRAPADLSAALLPHHDPPSTHHSRAPPVVS